MISDGRRWNRLPLALLGCIVALAVAVRIAWIIYANVDPLDGRADDTVFYYFSAKSLANTFEYRDGFGRYTAAWPPGYSLVLAGMFKLFGAGLWPAKALNVALSAATVVLTYALGARAFDRRAGLLGALALALFPGHVYFSTLIMAEVLFGFVFVLLLYLLLRWTLDERQARWPELMALGAIAGCATLIRSEAVLLPAGIALLWKIALPGWRTPARYAALLSAGFVLTMAPWVIRNGVRFHEFIPLRADPGGFVSIAFERDYHERGDRFVRRSLPLDETLGYMRRHPWAIVPLEIDKLRYLYHDDADGISWAQNDVPTLTPAQVRRWTDVANAYWFVIGTGALAALLWRPRLRDRGRLLLAFAVVSWTLIEIISWPFTRYHFPLLPVISLLAAAFVVRLWDAVGAREDPHDRAA